MRNIKRFIDDCTTEYNEFQLLFRAGYIDEDGCICNAQLGAQETFSIGMPVYGEDGTEIGRLSIGFFKQLNYFRSKIDLDIPVEYWRVDGYTGKRQTVRTYHQVMRAATPKPQKGGE